MFGMPDLLEPADPRGRDRPLAADAASKNGDAEASDAALARLQGLVLDERSQPLLLRGIRGERAILDEIIRRIRDAEIPIASLSGTISGDGTDDEPVPPVAPWGKLQPS